MSIQLYRTDLSGYFPENFRELEKKILLKVDQDKFTYLMNKNEIDTSKELILLTNSDSNYQNIFDKWQKQTKMIIHPNSGYDNVPIEVVKQAKFPIIIGHQIRANAVSEYILSALFTHYSKISHEQHWCKTRKWNRKLLRDLNILIIGHGHIGKKVFDSLSTFNNKINIYDPFKGNNTLDPNNMDCVILCAGLNQSSYHLINQDFLSKLSEDFLIINGARGKLIDQKALIETLKSRPEAFAYLDVYEKEPFDSEHFSDLTNIVTTSHKAGVYKNLCNELLNFEKQVLSDYLNDTDKFEKLYKESILKNKINGDYII